MKRTTTAALIFIAIAAGSSASMAQTGTTKPATKASAHKSRKSESEADLIKEAKISRDSAQAIALARVPGATVQSAEIEREKGRLIWSFDLKTPGKSGIDEVNVNALTGKVVGRTEHETPKTERKEAKQEAKEKK